MNRRKFFTSCATLAGLAVVPPEPERYRFGGGDQQCEEEMTYFLYYNLDGTTTLVNAKTFEVAT